MAKQIKVIKCPNCGSIHKTEIKPEHYRCDNCQTEYFLDNDDININVKHEAKTPIIYYFLHNSLLPWFVGGFILVFIIGGIKAIFTHKSTTPPVKITVSQPVKSETNPPQNELATAPIKYQINEQYCATTLSDDKAYVLSIEDRSDTTRNHKLFFTIYDLIANKKIKEEQIDTLTGQGFGSPKWSYLDFPNQTYLVINDSDIYLLDKTDYSLTKVTQSLLSNHEAYQTGIASITPSQTTSGSAFHILTNDGKKIYYYPLIDEVYVDDYDFQMLKNRPKKPANDTSEHLAFSFANAYGQDYKLIKYTFISPDGKNHIQPRSAKVGDYKLNDISGSKKHTDEASAYDLINNSNLDIKIVADKNLTPGRLYFAPAVVYFDNSVLIIKTKVNAAPGANYNYQQLDIDNGNLLWTLADQQPKIKEIIPFNTNFIAKQNCNQYAIIDSNGKITQDITLTDN